MCVAWSPLACAWSLQDTCTPATLRAGGHRGHHQSCHGPEGAVATTVTPWPEGAVVTTTVTPQAGGCHGHHHSNAAGWRVSWSPPQSHRRLEGAVVTTTVTPQVGGRCGHHHSHTESPLTLTGFIGSQAGDIRTSAASHSPAEDSGSRHFTALQKILDVPASHSPVEDSGSRRFTALQKILDVPASHSPVEDSRPWCPTALRKIPDPSVPQPCRRLQIPASHCPADGCRCPGVS